MKPTELQEAEIFDVDGTLCNVTSVRHYVTPPNRDFHSFHMASAFCPPHAEVVKRVHEAKAKGRAAIVVTARMARYRTLTRKWLQSCGIPFDSLRMRATDDFRRDGRVLVRARRRRPGGGGRKEVEEIGRRGRAPTTSTASTRRPRSA